MRADGLVNVHAEPVMVPHWERGEERAWIEAPHRASCTCSALAAAWHAGRRLDREVAVVSTMAGSTRSAPTA